MNSIDFYSLEFETPSGLADLTASAALDAVPHSLLWRKDICLAAAATSTIAQLRNKLSYGLRVAGCELNLCSRISANSALRPGRETRNS